MSERVVIIAPSRRVAQAEAEAARLDIESAAIVTPRSPAAARGLRADGLVVVGTIAPNVLAALVADVEPCFAASLLR